MKNYLLSDRRRDVLCTLTDDALLWEGAPGGRVPYAEIRSIRLYGSPGWISYGQEVTPSASICSIVPRSGSKLSLVSRRSGCDRTTEHAAFVADLCKRVAPFNIGIDTGMPRALWLLWAFVFLGMTIGFAFSSLGTIFLITHIFSKDASTLIEGFIGFGSFMVFTGLGALSTWRILRAERPRRQSSVASHS